MAVSWFGAVDLLILANYSPARAELPGYGGGCCGDGVGMAMQVDEGGAAAVRLAGRHVKAWVCGWLA